MSKHHFPWCCFWMFLFVLIALKSEAAFAQSITEDVVGDAHAFTVTVKDLGYSERTLVSFLDETEYFIRLPEAWRLHHGSFFELDFSYSYESLSSDEGAMHPPFFAELIVIIGDQEQVMTIRQPVIKHERFRVYFPVVTSAQSLAQEVYRVQVKLSASHLCDVKHRGDLTIHDTSIFFFDYQSDPLVPELAHYPRPFYQRAFSSDQVRFVLSSNASPAELSAAATVAAKLGDIAPNLVISTSLDSAFLSYLPESDETPFMHEHLFVLGLPQTNKLLLKLNELDVLPISIRERQFQLLSRSLMTVTPSSLLTYTFMITHTEVADWDTELTLLDVFPEQTEVVNCHPTCHVTDGEVRWTLPSLEVGEGVEHTLSLRLSDWVTATVLENSVTLLAEDAPLNVSTLTTTVTSDNDMQLLQVSASDTPYFFLDGDRPIPEHYGIVQELVSPWDATRMILVITGLDNAAIHKAGWAMGTTSYFPGMRGNTALVKATRDAPIISDVTLSNNFSLAELGYSDRLLEGYSERVNYYFPVPHTWEFTGDSILELKFSHSQLIKYAISFINVTLNKNLLATLSLNEQTSLNGEVSLPISASWLRPGQTNQLIIETVLQPLDICAPLDTWLTVSNASALWLNYEEVSRTTLFLDMYPLPFTRNGELDNLLFVLPRVYQDYEVESMLRLAFELGNEVRTVSMRPAVAFDEMVTQTQLENHHLLLFGRSSRNQLLAQINADLPQPFLLGSDQIYQVIDDVVFHLPPELNLGIVQLLISPWNDDYALLAVTGTTDDGVKLAMDKLINQPSALSGNLTLFKEEGISTIDTRNLTRGGRSLQVAQTISAMGIALITSTMTSTLPTDLSITPVPTNITTPTPFADFTASGQPSWLFPLVIGTGVVVVMILGIAFWQHRRRL